MLNPFRSDLTARRNHRELSLLRQIPSHPNVAPLLDCFTSAESLEEFTHFYTVSDLMDFDLSAFRRRTIKAQDHETLSLILYQIFCAVNHLHSNGVVHRDLKPDNLVVKSNGCKVKLIDFGLAITSQSANTNSDSAQNRRLSSYVYTRWYRAPEVVLLADYTTKADMWAIGCIFAEMILRRVYLPGTDQIDQWVQISSRFGLPDFNLFEKLSKNVQQFIMKKTSQFSESVPLELQFPNHRFPSGMYKFLI